MGRITGSASIEYCIVGLLVGEYFAVALLLYGKKKYYPHTCYYSATTLPLSSCTPDPRIPLMLIFLRYQPY